MISEFLTSGLLSGFICGGSRRYCRCQVEDLGASICHLALAGLHYLQTVVQYTDFILLQDESYTFALAYIFKTQNYIFRYTPPLTENQGGHIHYLILPEEASGTVLEECQLQIPAEFSPLMKESLLLPLQ